MVNNLELEFRKYCTNNKFEINNNQITVIKRLESYYNNNFKSFFSKIFSKDSDQKAFYLFGGVGV